MSTVTTSPIANPPTFGDFGSTAVANTANVRKKVAIASRIHACDAVTSSEMA
jgi:hypothetical protein